ncbi:unnamed protein product [Rhizoctonia solani]|uniref:Ribosomal RNA methyltransferase FtsJ domain-containing protein n=1 Tax=Rhizoctonia solani TaxID=456999 RepID=A0A8H3D0L6_9AGAM|nr:unnamed protein product [Rhizoctonia solani]
MPSPSLPALDAAAAAEANWLTEALLRRRDCDFRRFDEFRRHVRAMGFSPRFRSPPPDLAAQRADIMYRALRWMDQDSGHPQGFARRTICFLDIGTNPGGFARYILDHSRARGVGVSLPVDEGGIGRAVPPSDRFELHELNLLDLVSRYLQSDPASRSLPFSRTKFDLVILDVDPSRPCILIAQLLLALHTIQDGGQVLLTLSCIERPLAARTVIAFSRIADYISVSKPPQVQAWGGLFYLHAQTIRVDTPAYWKLTDNLERLWNRIHSTHTRHTRDPEWDEEDLIHPWEDVLEKSNMDLIVKLGNPAWGTRLTALYRAFGFDHNPTD